VTIFLTLGCIDRGGCQLRLVKGQGAHGEGTLVVGLVPLETHEKVEQTPVVGLYLGEKVVFLQLLRRWLHFIF